MIRWGMGWDCGWDSTYFRCCALALSAFFFSSDRASVRARSSILFRVGQRSFGWYHENNLLFTFVSPSTCTMQSISTWCNSSVPPFVHAVVPPSDKWRPLRNLSRVTSCIGVAGVSVAGNSSVASVRRHGGRGEVGDVEGTASAGAEESFGKQLEIRGFPAGVRPRFTLEDEGRSATSSSKRRHHMVSGSTSSTTSAAPQPLYGTQDGTVRYSPPLFKRPASLQIF